MVEKQNTSGRQGGLLVGITAVILLVAVGSMIFFVNVEGGQGKNISGQRNTPTIVPTLATPIAQPATQLLFFDEFADNTKGWAVSDSSGYSRTVEDGKLTLSGTNHKLLVESVPSNLTFSDFSVTLTFTLRQGDKNDSVGLFLRGDSNLDHDYRVDVYGDSTYTISKESLDEDNQQTIKTLVEHVETPWLQPMGKPNKLMVMMKGPTLVLVLNGAVIKSLTDTDYTHGQIALFVEHGSTSDGVSADFSSIVISSPPERLPI